MAAFSENESDEHWDLFRSGGVVLFKRRDILDAKVERLRTCGYQVAVVECSESEDEEAMLKAIVDALGIARYPGINLSGFDDFMSQIEFDDLIGVVVVLVGYDQFRNTFPDDAFTILDILADHHRRHMLFGDRFLALVQSSDPSIDERIGRVGGYLARWNSAEWHNYDRFP